MSDSLPSVNVEVQASFSSQRYGSKNLSIVSFENINYFVKDKKADDRRGKQILNSLSGIMKPGLNAIMGPTGCGKSSLLDILAGRKDPSGLTGNVSVNGCRLPKNFKRISGYVLQHDVATSTLTVRENLMFCANMRLPRSVSIKEKGMLIEETLSDLALTSCADTMIGNEMIRGVSGGEKKRACIAIELITSPSVLFLDEPTTGLDASTANAVIALLKKLSRKGRTIIFSIHQPRYSIFRLFDSLTLLSLGRMVYHGPRLKALPYFESLGYQCSEHNNPADFFLDIINGDSTALSESLYIEVAQIAESLIDVTHTVAAELNAKFKCTEIHQSTQKELKGICSEGKAEWFNAVGTYANPFWFQLHVLLKRAFTNVYRNPVIIISVVIVNILIGLTFGALFYQLDNSISPGTQNRFGVLFFICTNLLFSSISAMEVFLSEKEIFVHEYVSGYYMVLPYFIAKLVADLIPVRTVGPLMFASVTYWLVGLKPTAQAFFTCLVLLLLVGFAAVSVVLFFASTFSTLVVANTFVSLTFVFAILFAGLLLNVDSVVPWLGWIQHISLARYGYTALAINEFSGQVYTQCMDEMNPSSVPVPSLHCSKFKLGQNGSTCIEISGECFLQSQLSIGDGINPVSRALIWKDAGAIAGITLLLLTLTYIQLARTKTYN